MNRPSEILMDIKSVKAWLTEADYVPVVRCKDCMHFENGWCKNPRFTYAIVYGDFFCADGERKEQDDE